MITLLSSTLLLAATLLPLVRGLEIDNHLLGDPVVDCQDTMVQLTFTTEKPFTGRVYVKGLTDDDRCSRTFASNVDQSRFSMMVPTGDCGMQRQRVAGQLEGIVFSLVVVVSFHGTFVTKVDRAYRCMCFFRNIKRVTNLVDISAIGTTELLDTAKMPTCTYSLHRGAPTGPLVRYAKVGDKIFHVWECDDESQGFLVHSCWANDGRGAKFDFHDIDGCAVDPIIMSDIKYEPSLTRAYVETHGFKFSDTSVLNFVCVLELCKKAQGECDGLTPPNCGRGKRSVDAVSYLDSRPSQYLTDHAFDLLASVDILDDFDDDLGLASPDLDILRPTLNQEYGMLPGRTCVSSGTFGILLGLIVITFVTSVVTSSMLLIRSRKVETRKST